MTPEERTAIRKTAQGQFQNDAWLRMREAAEVLDVSYWTVSRWAARGEFCPAAVKLPNGQWRVRYCDLMDWIQAGPSQ